MKKVDHIVSVFLRQIVLRMKALGLNHTTLAQRLDVSRPYVIKVLHGDVNISFGTALRFAKALEMDFVPVLVPREKDNVTDVLGCGFATVDDLKGKFGEER